jgi:multicomponent Na+:H+ antiporter subunit B
VKAYSILRVVSKLLIPYILLFGLYVQFHGDYGPGGGFQAGVIFAAGLILYGLVFGLPAFQLAIRRNVIEVMAPLGVLVYAGTGILTILGGGNYLDYDVLEHHWGGLFAFLPHGQHLGIFLVELGVGITVTSVMITIFDLFAARGRRETH